MKQSLECCRVCGGRDAWSRRRRRHGSLQRLQHVAEPGRRRRRHGNAVAPAAPLGDVRHVADRGRGAAVSVAAQHGGAHQLRGARARRGDAHGREC